MKKLSQEFIDCIHQLLDNFWVLRKVEGELFFQIKQHEKALRDYFKDYFRFKLIVNNDFAKVEKFQISPQTSTGVSEFKEVKDYVMYYCLLAFLDGKASKQFALSDVCQAIVSYYPKGNTEDGEREVDKLTWKEANGYKNRLALIRVLKEAVGRGLIEVTDRNIEDFKDKDTSDALLKSTGLVKYFMRNTGFNVSEATNLNDMISLQEAQEHYLGVERKHLLYRRLFLEPVVYRHEGEEQDFDYLKQYGHHIAEHATKFFDMDFELYGSTALLTKESIGTFNQLFPSNNAESNLIVQFATLLRTKIIIGELNEQKDGSLSFTDVDLDILSRELVEQNNHRWTVGLKILSVTEIKELIKQFLLRWKFAEKQADGQFKVFDTIGRVFEK